MLDGASPISIGFVFVIIASVIGAATFFAGRRSSAHGEGEWRGELKATLKHMQDDISEIKSAQTKQLKTTNEAIESMKKDIDGSIRRLHERFNEHLVREHGKSDSSVV